MKKYKFTIEEDIDNITHKVKKQCLKNDKGTVLFITGMDYHAESVVSWISIGMSLAKNGYDDIQVRYTFIEDEKEGE